jgi:peptidyl-prolyl cis-trans isomerase C
MHSMIRRCEASATEFGVYFTGIISPMSVRQTLIILLGICFLAIFISSCSTSSPEITSTASQVQVTNTSVSSPEPSATPIPPTSTPVPLAAIVNGEGITLEEYEAELSRFQSATTLSGTILATDTNTVVLNELIDQTLLAQAAAENGFIVDDTVLKSRIEALENQLGSAQAMADWQATNDYTEETFNVALKRSIGAAWMRDQITTGVPDTAEQVHVLQILVPTQAEADQIYADLQSGKDFEVLATTFDPLTKGDLGWFPRGYISDKQIEEAAFGLQASQYSQVVHTKIGYHILYLVEREAEHPLLPDAKRVLQVNAVQDWLKERRAKSEIQILVP